MRGTRRGQSTGIVRSEKNLFSTRRIEKEHFKIKELFSPRNLASKLALFVGLSLTLIIVDSQFTYLDKVRYHVGVFAYAIRYIAQLPSSALISLHAYLQEQAKLLEKQERLQRENIMLHAQLSKMAALKQKNRHLQEVLKLVEKDENEQFTVVKLISAHTSLIEQKITINKGKLDGVYVGQPVLATNGIFGQVSAVTPISATVVLISSPGFTVFGEIERTSLRVIVRGTGNAERLQLSYVPTTADIRTGDRIVTSGLDRKYPYGYPIGIVSRIVKPAGDSFATIDINPSANLNHNLEILLARSTQTTPT